MRKNIRVYKGIIFDPTKKLWCSWNSTHESAASAIAWPPNGLTDDDHAPLMDLKKTPYEPVLTLGQVVHAWWERSGKGPFIRAADIEDLCSRLRNAFPNIDGEDA
jgi:hypothetical protein